jgi:curved DNA-binding protein
MAKDHYQTLGVSKTASTDDIKRAFRRLAKEYHPDRNKAAGAEDKFKQINEAHEVLSDPDKRAAYDQGGDPFAGFGNTHGGFGGFGGGFGGGRGAQDFSDLFSGMFNQGGNARREEPEEKTRISIPIEASYHGSTQTVQVGGRQFEVKIPQGAIAGQTIRMGRHLLEISFAPHSHFRTEGKDIHYTLNLMPWQAALGDAVSVPTLGGEVELNLPAGIVGGKKMRLKGRGLPASGKTAVGDQYILLNILTPKAETEEQVAFYQQMKALFGA